MDETEDVVTEDVDLKTVAESTISLFGFLSRRNLKRVLRTPISSINQICIHRASVSFMASMCHDRGRMRPSSVRSDFGAHTHRLHCLSRAQEHRRRHT